MTIKHSSPAMRAAEIMRSGNTEQTTIVVNRFVKRRKRTVQEIREAMMQASRARERDLA
ncbi:hypothetical protein AB6D68_01340 [Vibrio cyclitrophicus]